MFMKRNYGLIWAAGVLIALSFSGFNLAHPIPPTQDLKGEVVDEKNNPIMGAVCTLTSSQEGLLPEEGLSQTTSEQGNFVFPGLASGTYDLVCAAMGTEPVEQKGIQVSEQPLPALQISLPTKTVVREQVEVHEKISPID